MMPPASRVFGQNITIMVQALLHPSAPPLRAGESSTFYLRQRTVARVNWTLGGWNSGGTVESADLSPLLTEVCRPLWPWSPLHTFPSNNKRAMKIGSNTDSGIQVLQQSTWSENNALSLVIFTVPGTGCYPKQTLSDDACFGTFWANFWPSNLAKLYRVSTSYSRIPWRWNPIC